MIFSELFRLVWINIRENKFKVLLTSLGIVVGAATIVLVLAIGKGGREEVAEQFKNLNAGAIDITYKSSSSSTGGGMGMGGGAMMGAAPSGRPSGGGAPGTGGASGNIAVEIGGMEGGGMISFDFGSSFFSQNEESATLTTEDVEDLALFVPNITNATIYATTNSDVSGGELEEDTGYTIAGVQANYLDISNLTLALGEFITEEDSESQSSNIVLGADAATEIFGSAFAAYDSTLYIDGRAYVVAGVLAQMGNVASGIAPDSTIFMPYETAKKQLLGREISPTITVLADSVDEVKTVIANLETTLAESYPNSTFTITDAGSTMTAAQNSANTLSLLLAAVASIVFLVGGIGIMNVLFVSVKERTPEIGVLKALGCPKKDIVLEFLLEAICISCFGGVVGVLASFGLLPLLTAFGVRVSASGTGVLLALLFALVTGTVFGLYPAIKASRLVPVQALNLE